MDTPTKIRQWLNELLSQVGLNGGEMPHDLELLLRQAMTECEDLYLEAAEICATHCPELQGADERRFQAVMVELHRGLLIKILVEIAQYDRDWTAAERHAARIVMEHVFGQSVSEDGEQESIANIVHQAKELDWADLVKPFAELQPLNARAVDVATIAMRVGNLVAKADGHLRATEAMALTRVQRELNAALPGDFDFPELYAFKRRDLDRKMDDLFAPSGGVQTQAKYPEEPRERVPRPTRSQVTSDDYRSPFGELDSALSRRPDRPLRTDSPSPSEARSPAASKPEEAKEEVPVPTPEEREARLNKAMAKLDELIGLEPVKEEIRELVDFLKVQKAREEHDIPTTQVSLHSVFEGNPGTGKTTVARLVGEIFCGLGILDKGHTVETDRSGLVAQYAGQTAPRTHERIDEALDGVLFIDEAYSLVAKADDAFGTEAVQALLKRMEDDRKRLVVVLAGYPRPMKEMLQTNPGLTSRFQQKLHFPDYSAEELLGIFELMCKKNHYVIADATRERLTEGFQYSIDNKDEHFGNGRLSRNTFERAIRCMASRIANITPLTKELLTTLQPPDIEMPGLESLAVDDEGADSEDAAEDASVAETPAEEDASQSNNSTALATDDEETESADSTNQPAEDDGSNANDS